VVEDPLAANAAEPIDTVRTSAATGTTHFALRDFFNLFSLHCFLLLAVPRTRLGFRPLSPVCPAKDAVGLERGYSLVTGSGASEQGRGRCTASSERTHFISFENQGFSPSGPTRLSRSA
jgi:hypothetical protein